MRSCPFCRKAGRLLPALGSDARVYFHCCEKCGAVWTHDQRDPNASPKLILQTRDDLAVPSSAQPRRLR